MKFLFEVRERMDANATDATCTYYVDEEIRRVDDRPDGRADNDAKQEVMNSSYTTLSVPLRPSPSARPSICSV